MRLSYANVTSTLALFIALGGSSYAAVTLKKGSVGSRELRDSSVRGRDVHDGTLTGADLAPGTLPVLPSLSGLVRTTDPRLRDARAPKPGSVTQQTLASALVDALPGSPSLRSLGTGHRQAAAGDDPRLPTTDQREALLGASVVPPGLTNPFVTSDDPRLVDARPATGNSVASGQVADHSLRLADQVVWTNVITLGAIDLPADGCFDLGATSPAVQAGDVLVGALSANAPATMIVRPTVQVGGDHPQAPICSHGPQIHATNVTIRFDLLRP